MLLVYTVSIGSKYSLQPVPVNSSNVRFACVTDQQYEGDTRGWEIVKVDANIICGDSHRSSRYFKILAHKLFPGFERSIYIDTTIRLTGDPEDIWSELMPSESCLFGGFLHSFRNNLVDEFLEVEGRKLDYRFSLYKHYSAYKQFSPELLNHKPVWGGFLARRHNNLECIGAMELWFYHVLSYSRRDQLSLPYCLSRFPASRVNLLSQDNFKSDFHELLWKATSKPANYMVDDFEVKLSKTVILSEEMRSANVKGYIEKRGKKFAFSHPRMNDSIRNALIRGDYEKPETELIEQFITASDKVIELGICIGYTTMRIYDIVGEKLYLFEADPLTAELAQLNMGLNHLPIKVNNYVLLPDAINKGRIEFYSSPNASSSSTYMRGDKDTKFDVKTLSFEATIKILGATALVIDIEGGEVDLMIHCSDWSEVSTIIMETHERVVGDEAMKQAFENMIRNGFKLAKGGEGQFGFAVFKKT